MKVFIVLHHEIMGTPDDYWADEMVFYVVSSMAKALRAIKTVSVDRCSWWEIQKQTLDDPEHNWPEHVGYFGLRGGKLKKPPHDKCVEIFKKRPQLEG